jgi:hypothetical protein
MVIANQARGGRGYRLRYWSPIGLRNDRARSFPGDAEGCSRKISQPSFLIGRVYCSASLPELPVEFIREQLDKQRVRVNAMVNNQLHTQTVYVQKQGLSLTN